MHRYQTAEQQLDVWKSVPLYGLAARSFSLAAHADNAWMQHSSVQNWLHKLSLQDAMGTFQEHSWVLPTAESSKAYNNKPPVFVCLKMQIGLFHGRKSSWEKKTHLRFLQWLLGFVSVQNIGILIDCN